MKKLLIVLVLAFGSIIFAQAQHFVVLKNGKKIECVVTGLKNDTLEIYVNMYLQKIPIIEVTSIYFDQHVPYDGKLANETEEKSMQSGAYLIKYKIKGRKMVKAPVISNGTDKKGRVVVKVVIDKYGNVLKAEPGYVGSTTSDTYLLTKAMNAAKDAKFDTNPTGPLETEGLIIIEY